MGDRIKGITIEIDGNTSKLSKALQGVNKDIRDTNSALKDVNKLLEMDPGNVTLLKQKQDLLKKAVQDTTDKLDKEKAALEQLKNADQTPEVQSQMAALERQITDDEAKLQSFKGELTNFGSVAKQQLQATGDKFKAVGDKISGLGEKLAPVSAAAAGFGGALLKMGYDAVTGADELNTLSKQTGISVEELQKMQYAADLVDVSVDDITGALRKMKPKMSENNETFKELGVEVTNADGSLRSATDVFYDSIAALSQISNETERDQVAMELFGKGADELAGIIDDGGAALKQYGQEAADAGLILSGDTVNALNETNDTIDKVKMQMSGTMAEVGAEVAQVLAPALEKVAEGIKTIMEKIRALSPEQQETILKIAGIVAAIAPLLMVIGTLVSSIGSIISAVGSVSSVFTMLSGPVGIVVAAIAAAIAIGVLLYENWDKICEWAGKLRDTVVEAWESVKEGVSNAIEAVKNFVTEKWNAIKTTVVNVGTAIGNAVKEKWNAVKTNVSNAMNAAKSTVSNALGAMKTAYQNAGGGIKGIVSGWMAGVKSIFSSAFDVINSLTGGRLTAVKDKFVSIFNSIKDTVHGIIEKIKGFFNFTFQVPKLKLPHFTISPAGWKLKDLLEGIKPSLSIEWYKRAYNNPVMFNTPTVVPTANGLMGFGDGVGGEIVVGAGLLTDMIQAPIMSLATRVDRLTGLVAAIAQEGQKEIYLNGRELTRGLKSIGVQFNG